LGKALLTFLNRVTYRSNRQEHLGRKARVLARGEVK
jgi:hypothetical protein